MKLKKDFVIRKVAGVWVVMAIGAESMSFNKMLKLNETGAFLWELLAEETDSQSMAEALAAEYGIDRAIALKDVDAFVESIGKAGCLE